MWSIIRNLTGNLTYTVKVHRQETRTCTQLNGLGQGPVCSPNKYNTSIEPQLKELEAAGAGVQVDGKLIMGVGWSDDLYTIVQEDHLEPVLQCIEKASKTFRKNYKPRKASPCRCAERWRIPRGPDPNWTARTSRRLRRKRSWGSRWSHPCTAQRVPPQTQK
jgi:hypothetical protein